MLNMYYFNILNMLATITAITIEIDQNKFNDYVQYLVDFHNYTLDDARAEARREMRVLLRQKVRAADLPISSDIDVTWSFV